MNIKDCTLSWCPDRRIVAATHRDYDDGLLPYSTGAPYANFQALSTSKQIIFLLAQSIVVSVKYNIPIKSIMEELMKVDEISRLQVLALDYPK